MNISIITPTRKRFDSLKRSAESLLATRTNHDVEFMVALDDDDLETIEKLRGDPLPNMTALVGPRRGYVNLHEYVNVLCAASHGDWLFLWNDDALMETKGWDSVIAGFQGQVVVLNPETNHGAPFRNNCIFPIIPKKMFELLGHFSLSNHNDSYVERIADSLGIRRDIPIRVCHDRADITGANNDEVFAEREFTTDAFYGPDIQGHIRKDVETLGTYLNEVAEGSL